MLHIFCTLYQLQQHSHLTTAFNERLANGYRNGVHMQTLVAIGLSIFV